ncbi:MAG: reverse transcriptase family protein [bacterium]
MATVTVTDLLTRWRAIRQAGGVSAFIDAELKRRGFIVQRSATAQMSKAELARYKKALKDEAAEKRKIAREAWAAYKAAHIVHLGDGVFFNDQSDFDRYDLPEPEARANENELPKLDNPQALADALGLTLPELRWMAYHRDLATKLHYRRFTIPKKSGGERAIWAPLPKLKAAQRWIHREIVEHLPVHGAAHGFLPGRSIFTNAKAHTASQLVVGLDLADFFPTVTWRRVKGVFRHAGYREQVATLLALICTEAPREIIQSDGQTLFAALGPRCLPQGAPTSPALTNTLCLRLDRRLSGLATKLGWRYTRYADDLTFSLPAALGPKSNAEARIGTLIGSVERIAIDEGFAVNRDKTRVLRPGDRQQVTGLVVNGDAAPRVPRDLRRTLRAAIHNLEQGKPLRPDETLAKLTGYAAFVHLADPEEGRALLDRLRALDR